MSLEIRVQDLEYIYSPGTPLEVVALAGVSFVLPRSSVLGVLGGTGSGKTTLVKNLNGLLLPTKGSVLVDGKDTASYGSSLRREVGVVFQRPERQLFEETVYLDISFVLRRTPDVSADHIRQKVEEACGLVGLNLSEIGDRSPMTLADGHKRKVALAGTLVNNPRVLVLDEPAVGLDPPSLADTVGMLRKMKRSGDRSIIIVSHDMGPFFPRLDLMLVLHQGKVWAFGSLGEVCGALAQDAVMREFLPEQALMANYIRKASCSLSPDEFGLQEQRNCVVNHTAQSSPS